MDLNTTRIFVSVVQAGSLSAAAARTNMPLATISRRISELERQVAVQLITRSRLGVQLTDAGLRFYEEVGPLIAALEQSEQAVMNDQVALKGRLRLSLPQTFRPWWVLLEAFQQKHPDIRVQVHSSERRVDLLEDGIDVALRVGAIVHDSMIARRMLSFRNVLVAGPQLIKRLGHPSSPADLLRFPCATWATRIDSEPLWMIAGQPVRIDPVLATNDYDHLMHRVIAGQAVTELPPFLAARHVSEGRLIPLLTGHPLPEWPVHLVYPRQRHQSAIVRAYLDFCTSHIQQVLDACELPKN